MPIQLNEFGTKGLKRVVRRRRDISRSLALDAGINGQQSFSFAIPGTNTMNQPILEKANFDRVLEMADSLSPSEQEFLIEILKKRLGENRRKEIAANIAEAHAEYKMGKTKRITVNELMAGLDE